MRLASSIKIRTQAKDYLGCLFLSATLWFSTEGVSGDLCWGNVPIQCWLWSTELFSFVKGTLSFTIQNQQFGKRNEKKDQFNSVLLIWLKEHGNSPRLYANIPPSSSNIEIRLTCHLSTVAVCEMLQCANWLRFITAEQSDLSSKVFQGCRPFTLPRLLHKCKLFQLLEKKWISYSCLNWNKKMFCSYFSHKSETIAEIQHMTNKDHMIWGWGGWQGTVTLPEGQHKEDKYFNIERKLYDEERMWSGKRFGSRELGLQERKGMTWQRGLRRDFQMEQYRWVKARAPNCSWSCLQPLNWYSSPSTLW